MRQAHLGLPFPPSFGFSCALEDVCSVGATEDVEGLAAASELTELEAFPNDGAGDKGLILFAL